MSHASTKSGQSVTGPCAVAGPDDLPVLATTGAEVAGLAADARIPLATLARAVMADPALAVRVLYRANQVHHRHFRMEVSSLEDAIRMLGTDRLTRMALDAPCTESCLPDAVRAQYRCAAARGMLAGLLAAELATLRHDLAPPEVTLAALLHNLGELYKLATGDRRVERYIEHVDTGNALPHEAEYVTLGESLETVGHGVAEAWGLPEMVREGMRARNALHMRTLGVMLAAQLARHALTGWSHPMAAADMALTADYLGQTHEAVAACVNRVLESFNGEVHRYGLAALQSLPDPLQSLPYRAPFCLAPRSDCFAQALNRLREGSLADRNAVLEALCTGLHHGLGLNRVAYAALGPRSRVLAAEVLVGTDFEPAFNRFRLSIDEGGLVARLMKRPSIFWLNDDNRERAWRHVPASVQSLIGVQGFFIMSVFVAGKPTGLVYADRRCGQCRLDARSYGAFRVLGQLAVQNLERLAQRSDTAVTSARPLR